MLIAAVDPSLTSTGLALVEDGKVVRTGRLRFPKLKGHERLDAILEGVWELIDGCDLVGIEGPSYGSTGGSQHERAGLWWLIAREVRAAGIPMYVVAPTARVKYATGAGNKGKDEVLAAAIRRYSDVDITGNDVADAVVIAAMGARYVDTPIDGGSVPVANLAALDKVTWPEGWNRG